MQDVAETMSQYQAARYALDELIGISENAEKKKIFSATYFVYTYKNATYAWKTLEPTNQQNITRYHKSFAPP